MSKSPQTITVLESHLLLNQLLKHSGTNKGFRKGLRNYTMGCLMLDAGLRVGEIAWLLIENLNFNRNPKTSITITKEVSKTNCERTIPLSRAAQDAIAEMQKYYWNDLEHKEYCFAFFNHENH